MASWPQYYGLRALGGILSCLFLAGAAGAQQDLIYTERPLKYGDYFRDQYVLHATERDGWVDVELTQLGRATGGPFVDTSVPTYLEMQEQTLKHAIKGVNPDDQPIIRYRAKRILCRVRAEIIAPAPANFLKNPGRRYRITMQGMDIAPEYNHIFQANADQVLDLVEAEFWELYRRAHGMDREAIYFGMILAMRALNETQRLPARVPMTVLESEAGRAAIEGPFMDHRATVKLERFGNIQEGKALNKLFQTDLDTRPTDGRTRGREDATRTPAKAQLPGQTRTTKPTASQIREAQRTATTTGFRGVGDAPTAADYRAQQLREVNSPEEKNERIGQRLQSLVGTPRDYQAAHEASQKNLQLLTGSGRSALEARAGAGR